MTRLRVAVVGVGYLGRFHAQKYAALPAAELVAVCDLRESVGQAVARELGTAFCMDYRDLLGTVDAVTIAASTAAHFELTRFFLDNGVHVFVEKPMTPTSREARVLTALAERRGLKLQVGHVERFNPALLSARDALDDVRFIECHRLAAFKSRGADIDVVLDLMIHDLDLILSLVEAGPRQVSAVGIAVLSGSTDIANARIEFANGAIANVTASRVSMSAQRKFRVFQENQYVSIDFGGGEVRRVTSAGAARQATSGIPAPDATSASEARHMTSAGAAPLQEEKWRLDKGDALLAEAEAFVDSVIEDRPCRVTGRDGIAALELAEAVIAAIERGSRRN